MHELGVLCHAVRTVSRIAEEHQISHIKYITLEVGQASGYVPAFLKKLFPVVIEHFPAIHNAMLKIESIPGKELRIKDIGY